MVSCVVAAVILVMCVTPRARAEHVDDVQSAREHYAKGKRLYDLGRFADAAREYEAAYQAKDDPALLFNLGQAHRLAGNYPQALLAYKAYLRNVPNAPNRREVEARINEMQTIVDEQTRTSQKPPQGTMEPKPLDTSPAAGAAAAGPATGEPATGAPPGSATAAPATSEPSASATLTREAAPAKTPVYKRWWLWTAVGVVAVGVGVGLGVGLGAQPKNPSPSIGGVTF